MAQARLCNITQCLREKREKPMPRFRTVDDLDVSGKRVLVRADLNVPIKDCKVTDATRIERLVPTIDALIQKGAKVIVLSHFGRPKGPDPKLSLRPLVEPLSRAIGRPVYFAPDCIGPEAERVVAALKPGEVALLENLRFHKGEGARLRGHLAGRRGDRRKARSGRGNPYCRDQRGAADRDDPRYRAPERGAYRGGFRGEPHLGVERAGRRLRDAALRARHGRAGEKGRRIDPCRQIAERRGRRRHRGGARHGRGHEPAQLCLDRRRRLSRMARRPGTPRGQGARDRLRQVRSPRWNLQPSVARHLKYQAGFRRFPSKRLARTCGFSSTLGSPRLAPNSLVIGKFSQFIREFYFPKIANTTTISATGYCPVDNMHSQFDMSR